MPTSTLHAMINMKLIAQLSFEERSPRRSETNITTRRRVGDARGAARSQRPLEAASLDDV
eukprot:3973221-Prymnesium_polylepis.1